MAKVRFVIAQRSMAPSVPPISAAEIISSGQITSSASSQDSGLTATYETGTNYWSITASGGDVSVLFGATLPTATAATGWLITDGQTREFLISPNALKCAVIDA